MKTELACDNPTMNDYEAQTILLAVFERLRKDLNLGIGELLAAYRAVSGAGPIPSPGLPGFRGGAEMMNEGCAV